MYIANKNIDCHPFMDDTNETYGCIILDTRDRILLVKSTTKLSFPKGSRKRAETGEECAIREVWEETGLDLSNTILGLSKRLVRGRYYFIRLPCVFESYKLCPQPKEKGQVCWMKLDTFAKLSPDECNIDIRLCLEKMNIITNRLTSPTQ